MKYLARLIYFKLLGWKLQGDFDKIIKKCVIVVAPHTSWWDFFIGVLVRRITGVEIDFIGKKELFVFPIGWYFRWMGGTALDRRPGQKTVDAITAIFSEKEIFRLSLSPEGTREKTLKWKSGFYYIALKAEVPIILTALDFGSKTVKISSPFYPTGDFEEDFKVIFKFYEGVKGKVSENF